MRSVSRWPHRERTGLPPLNEKPRGSVCPSASALGHSALRPRPRPAGARPKAMRGVRTTTTCARACAWWRSRARWAKLVKAVPRKQRYGLRVEAWTVMVFFFFCMGSCSFLSCSRRPGLARSERDRPVAAKQARVVPIRKRTVTTLDRLLKYY